VNRIEPAKCIGDRQHTTRQMRQSLEMSPGTGRKCIVPDAFNGPRMAKRVVDRRRDQPAECRDKLAPAIEPLGRAAAADRRHPAIVLNRHQPSVGGEPGRIRLCQHHFPVLRYWRGNFDHRPRITGIDADFSNLGPFAIQAVEQRRRWQAPPEVSTTRSVSNDFDSPNLLSNRTDRAAAWGATEQTSVTLHSGQHSTLAMASTQCLRVSSIKGLDAPSSASPRSRCGSAPTSARSYRRSRAISTGTAPASTSAPLHPGNISSNASRPPARRP
jgi:hypothetical protein